MARKVVVDEQRVLKVLRNPTALITPDFARGLCSMVVVSAHQHNVNDKFMVDVLNTVTEITCTLGELETAGRMRQLLAKVDPGRAPEVLDAEIEKLCASWTRLRGKLAEHLELLTACAGEDDAIN